MNLASHWLLPTGGDSRYLVAGGSAPGAISAAGDRDATLTYLTQVTVAAEQSGFAGVALPAGAWDEDGLVTAALLAGTTRDVRFLVALRPDLVSPAHAAQMATTFQRHTGGRLLLDLPDSAAADLVRCLRGTGIPLYLGDPELAARDAEVHVVPTAPPPEVAAHIARVRARSDREVRFAVRLHVITRDTSGQAWAQARRLLAALGAGPARLFTAHSGDAAQLEVHPNLWAGTGLVPGGADLALVGNHAEVAARIEEFAAAGIDELILSGRPALEEAYWFADGVLPRLTRGGTAASAARPPRYQDRPA